MGRPKRKASAMTDGGSSSTPANSRRGQYPKEMHVGIPPTLIGILSQPSPIHDLLWKCLDTRDALRVGSTCKILQCAYSGQFNINRRLERFVKDPNHLRSLLGSHNALLAGEIPLQLFSRVQWGDEPLDVVVESNCGEKAWSVVVFDAHFTVNEGYTVVPTEEQDLMYYADDREEPIEIRRYMRRSRRSQSSEVIRLIWSTMLPISFVLSSLYMTAVVNVITWNRAYSVFARDTFIDYKSYLLRHADDNAGATMGRLARRGWRLEEAMNSGPYPPGRQYPTVSEVSAVRPLRRLNDRHTWIIKLPIDCVDPSQQPDYVLEISMFTMWPEVCSRSIGLRYYWIGVAEFQHLSLRFRYVTTLNDWRDLLAKRLSKRARLGLWSLDAATERPRWANKYRALEDDWRHSDVPQFQKRRYVDQLKEAVFWRPFQEDEKVPIWCEDYFDWDFRIDLEIERRFPDVRTVE